MKKKIILGVEYLPSLVSPLIPAHALFKRSVVERHTSLPSIHRRIDMACIFSPDEIVIASS
jgi:hypothetical protein